MDPRCPRALHPRPTWALSVDLDALQLQAAHRAAPLEQPPVWASTSSAREGKAFVMRVEEEDGNSDYEDARAPLTTGPARLSCASNSLESSFEEESGDGSDSTGTPRHLMQKTSLEKSTLLELERRHRLKEEVRSKLSSLDQNESRRRVSAFARLQRYAESRKELDRTLDARFQRKIAQVLDRHLSMVQGDRRQKSQIVETRIRDGAAAADEEATRREPSMKEEETRQEEARQKVAAKLAAEAHEAAKKGAVEKEAAKSSAEAVSTSSQIPQNSVAHATMANSIEIGSELQGIRVYADSSALEAESRRRALHDQVPSNIYLGKEYTRCDRQIGKSIGKLMPTTDSVEARASELIKALDGQDCPRPIACRLFADKMISVVKSRNPRDKTFENFAFACGYVMLLVADEVPDAMDYLLAELHKVCIYTVPKHLRALNSQAQSRDYFRLTGYQEEDGKFQSTEAYLVNVVAYVKLYAAMIQTDIKGVRHPHGLAEGWKWLAMFLNTLPAITATAFALHAFLKMAGFALHRRYGSQFMKILDVISRQLIPALKEQCSKVQPEAINNLQNYLNDKYHLEEPEGQYLAQRLMSKVFM